VPKLITVTEAAGRLGCSRGHVYNLIAAGLIPRHDISLRGRSKTRVLDEDLDAYIQNSLRPVTQTAS